jgi:lipopolysaccharide export system protein LptA
MAMSERSFIKSLSLLIFIFSVFSPQEILPAPVNEMSTEASEKKSDSPLPFLSVGQPIEITSDRLTADNQAKTAVFDGSVKAKQGETLLSADWMKVFYSEGGDITRIHARGGVHFSRRDREISSEEATYFQDEGKVVFTGNPVAKDSKGTITGTKMIYFTENGRSIVENSHVILKRSSDNGT